MKDHHSSKLLPSSLNLMISCFPDFVV